MDKGVFILVGPDGMSSNPGGVGAVAIGLCEYAFSTGHLLEIIDTAQGSFPVPPLKTRVKKGLQRVYKLFRLLTLRRVKGVVILGGAGVGFYERTLMAGICRLYGVKSVFYILNEWLVKYVEGSLIAQFLAKSLLKLPNVISIQGDSSRSFYLKLGVSQTKIVTIRNWLTDNFLQLANPICLEPNKMICFCFVGWLVEEKGVVELFNVIVSLSKKYNFEFIFVGGGTLESYLQEKISQNKLSDRVMLTSWVESRAVKTYLEKSHVFVLPSQTEGFPISLLEAMSLGLPAICTDVGTISDSLINGLNGYLLKDGSAVSIMQAMENYLIAPELIHRHSVEALNMVRREHNRDLNCGLLFGQFK
jgi:glycosyltransferase involved in cell wall biosynthesis